ncbi:MAG: hypothetical protein COA84_01315 [Robiginitomaculum sp.]|nr:MAG: hypothetical protein COA84_01315 [Robiginitomaculum sp.]
MQILLTRILVICLIAISLHGFVTDDHVFEAQGDEALVMLTDATDKSRDTAPNLGYPCETCEIVHHYVALNTNPLALPVTSRVRDPLPFRPPSGHHASDILHPPTA